VAHNKFRNCIDKYFMVNKAFRSYADIKKDFIRLILILKGFLGFIDIKSLSKILLKKSTMMRF